MNSWRKKLLLYSPLILVEIYLLFTIVLYQFGPLDWKTENEGMFWFFLAMYHIAFIGGYLLSTKAIKARPSQMQTAQMNPRLYRWLIWGVLAVCVVCACIEYKNLTHASSYIPYELPKNFIAGLINPAKQYYSKFTAAGVSSSKLVTAISALFSFLYVSLIPLMVVEWKRFSVPQRIVAFLIILFKVVTYVSVATNKGIFDTMFSFAGILLVLVLLNVFHGNDAHIDKKTFLTVAAFTLFLVIFSFTYFTANISSRVSSPVDYAMNVAGHATTAPATTAPETTEPETTEPETTEPETTVPETTEPETTESETTVPEATTPAPTVSGSTTENQPKDPPKKQDSFLKRMLYSVSNYLCQGYYGMSLSLDEEFTTTYGIGSSQFLMSNFKSLFGIDVKDRTYQHKVDALWDEDGKWHSFYSYIANDVSFYGVIAVMFLIGLFFGCICRDVFLNNSLIGKLLLPLFVVLFMYMPANNQVFTGMATCTAFLELSFLWILSKLIRKRTRHE